MRCFFFFNDTATTEIYTLSLHDALPISDCRVHGARDEHERPRLGGAPHGRAEPADQRSLHRRVLPGPLVATSLRGIGDRKSTRLNSSHANISYAVFCLKKNKTRLPSSHL